MGKVPPSRRIIKLCGDALPPLVLLLFICLELYAITILRSEGKSPLPATFGNFEHVRKQLRNPPQDQCFSFAVVGDTKGRGTFERIFEQLKDEPLSFLVLLGDCVRKGTEGYHSYLRAEWATEFAPSFPVFYVMGNHDVDEETFPISRFEEVYGPSIFSFEYQQNLFVVLRMLKRPYSNEESFEFLNKLLSADVSRYDKIFLFMHIPPPISLDMRAGRLGDSERLVSLVDKLGADYVIAGDYHGYARVMINNATYIVSGSGGARLKKAKFGRFHHAIVLEVGENYVSERILFVERDVDPEDTIERYALAEFLPWVSENRALAIAGNVVLLILFVALVVNAVRGWGKGGRGKRDSSASCRPM